MTHTSFEDIRARRRAAMGAADQAHYGVKKAELAAALRTGIAIRDTRKAAGLTQTELAARMGVAQSALARIEAGRTNITVATMVKVAAGLGTALDFTVGPDGSVAIGGSKPARRTPVRNDSTVPMDA